MKIRPLHDWAVIRRIDAGEKTAGGIIIPAVAREKPAEGIVEAIGPGKYSAEGRGKKERFVPTTVKPGQQVVFTDFAARDTEVDGQQFTFVREEDILGTYEGDRHPALKKSHAVSVREEMPLLVPGKAHAKPAVSETPIRKSGAAAGAGASRKDDGARKQAVKKATGTRLQKMTKTTKKKEEKPKKTTKKTVRKPVRKITKKPVSAKRPKAASGKIARKPGGGRRVAARKAPVGKKKSAARKSRAKK